MTETTTPRTGEDTLRVDDFNPLEPATVQCPYRWYQTLRDQAPVHFVASMGMWFVTSHELVTEAALNHEVFSSAFGLPQMPPPESVAEEIAAIQAEGWEPVPTLLTADPPEHHYYRRMVAKAFTRASSPNMNRRSVPSPPRPSRPSPTARPSRSSAGWPLPCRCG